MQTETAKSLTIENHSNKLASDCFIVIDVAPPADRIPTRSDLENRLYTASYNNETVFVKIIDLLFLPLHRLTDHFTWWGYNMHADDFINQVLKPGHPRLNSETPLIIYYYQKAKQNVKALPPEKHLQDKEGKKNLITFVI